MPRSNQPITEPLRRAIEASGMAHIAIERATGVKRASVMRFLRGARSLRLATAARQVLADLERKAELVRSGVMTATEAAIGDHQAASLAEHFDAYLAHLEAAGVTKEHRANVKRQLHRLAADCAFGRLADLSRD